MTIKRPEDDVSWAEDPQAETSEPVGERARGWPFQYVPPAEQKNWLQRGVGRWIDYLGQGGGSFDSMPDAVNALTVGGSAAVRLPDGVENKPYFQALVRGLGADVGEVYLTDASDADGRRFFCALVEAATGALSVAALEFDGTTITQAAQTATSDEDVVQSISTDGKTLAVLWQEIDSGSPTGDFRVDLYDAAGDLSSTIDSIGYTGADDVRDAVCIGSHVVVCIKNGTTSTIRLEGYEAENYILDYALELPAEGVISSGDFEVVPGALASNGEYLALFVGEGDDRFVFFFLADGSAPAVAPSTDWPDVLAYAQILPTVLAISAFGILQWVGSTCYVATDSAIGSGNISAVRLRETQEPSAYIGEVDPEVVWRGTSIGPGGEGDFIRSITTDGERLYLCITDSAENVDTTFLALDTEQREQREEGGGSTDPVQWLKEEYILQVNDPDQDTADSLICDGMYLWSVRGVSAPNRVDLLSTTRQSRRFHRVDGGQRFRQPFHNLLVPEGY